MNRTVWHHPVVRTLARDPFVRAFAAVSAVEVIAYLLLGAPTFRPEFGTALYQVPLVSVVVAGAFSGLGRVVDREERRFWLAIGVSCLAWLAAVAMYAFARVPDGQRPADLVIDSVFLASYVPLLLAVVWRPHQGPSLVAWEPDRWSRVASASCIAAGWFAYFVLAPACLDPRFYGSRIPAQLLYVTLDLTLVVLYFAAGRRCGVRRWRTLYWAVGAGSLAMGVTDTLDLAVNVSVLTPTSGHLSGLSWLLPSFVYLLAIRLRHAPIGTTETSAAGAAGPSLEERTRRGGLALAGAFAFLLVHLWFDSTFAPAPALAQAQGLAVLLTLGLLGGVALVSRAGLGLRYRQLANTHVARQQLVDDAQRLEAVGRLAGGVAHDFNNMLASIVGYNDMAMQDLPADDPNRAALEQIARTAERAAGLTRQLLALSRRQILKPERVDVNAIIEELDPMLARIIGEDLRLVTKLAPALDAVTIDPSQLRSVILTLVANARDAMPDGGTVFISTSSARVSWDGWPADLRGTPGEHVELSIADSGPAVPADVLPHVFEPFFATAAPGRGAGLGLAAAHGIITQSGGTIEARCEPGRGAEFVIRLPCTTEAPVPPRPA